MLLSGTQLPLWVTSSVSRVPMVCTQQRPQLGVFKTFLTYIQCGPFWLQNVVKTPCATLHSALFRALLEEPLRAGIADVFTQTSFPFHPILHDAREAPQFTPDRQMQGLSLEAGHLLLTLRPHTFHISWCRSLLGSSPATAWAFLLMELGGGGCIVSHVIGPSRQDPSSIR